MSVKRIIQESLDKNPLGVKEALEEALQDRVRAALEEKYEEMMEAKDDDDDDDDEDDMDESFDFSDYTVEELEDFMESAEFDQLDEISKKTLASYVRKNMDSGAEPPNKLTPLRDIEKRKSEYNKRLKGFGRATDKLTGRARVNATEEFDLDEGVNHSDWKAHHDQMHQKHISAGDHDSAELHSDAKDAHSKAINTGSKSDSKKALELSRKARNNDKKMGSYSRTGAGLGPAGARVG